MDPATLYMLAICVHTLCYPLNQHGFTMTKVECEAKALEMRLEKPRPIGCLGEAEWALLIKNITPPKRPPGPFAH
jgi:hypothetical protein